jgi:hypothetical protein
MRTRSRLRRRRGNRSSEFVRLAVFRLEDRALPAVNVAVDASLDQHAINSMIYGTAFATTAQLQDLNSPYNRSGGNAETRYNWQINASNHAADWYFESIRSNGGSAPSGEADAFISSTKAAGAQATITVPTIGWVAKLGSGGATIGSYPQGLYPNQTGYDPNWSSGPQRPGNGQTSSGPITGVDPNNANQPSSPAAEQGWIQHLVATFGAANAGGVKYYTMDNEPSIWFQTHRDVHPTGPTMSEVEQDIVNYSAMIKSVDPNALIVGPEEWGWSGYFYSGYDQQYAAAHNYNGVYPDRQANGNMDYMPWVLNQLHLYDQAHGTKSLDVFSFHYYPQENNVFSNAVDMTTENLRNQSTRALWDSTFTDPSWINSQVDLIPRMQGWVNQYYPGLATDLSEYNFGAEGNMNGATAQADVDGILGRQGVDMANRWTTPATGSPTYLAMKMYRNYDGQDSTFGQTNVRDTVANPDQVSSYAALRSDGSLTVMVINKNLFSLPNSGATTPITINLANFTHGSSAQLWQLAAIDPTNQNNAAISHLANVSFSGDTLTINAPMESVSLFVIPAAVPAKVSTIQVNDGNAQRSEVRSISVTFNDAVTFAGGNASAAAAFALRHVQTGNNVVLSANVSLNGAGQTVVKLTFSGGETDSFSTQGVANPVDGLSLADGRYTLTINGATITGSNGAKVDAAGNGTAGSTYTSPADAFGGSGLHLYRLYGDVNGDGVVDSTDLGQVRTTFNANNTQANYLQYLDANNDGVFDSTDLGQFRTRFNANVF